MSAAVGRQIMIESNGNKIKRLQSKMTEDSGLGTDEESNSLQSDDFREEDYHFVQALKVLGVHKQEKPKVHYLFVIVVRWNDKSQVTVYRKWSDIKEFQRAIVKTTKGHKHQSEAHHYIKKTAHRVRKVAKFRHGTIKKLDMIDSLNSFFEAIVHYEDTAHSATVRRFFKPNDSDLNSVTWSGDGRTYFYITPSSLGEKNDGFDINDNETCDDSAFDDGIDTTRHINKQGAAVEQTQDEWKDALDKYNEADPNISWPIRSSIFVAICDYDASKEDSKDNIIGLKKGEEIEVLEKSETGWWLVSRTTEKPKSKSGINECGYVPASFLELKARKVVAKEDNESVGSDSSVGIDDGDDVSRFSFGTVDEPVEGNNNESNGDPEDVDSAGSSDEAFTSGDASFQIDSFEESLSLPKRGLLQRSDTVESFGSMNSVNDSDWTASPFTSMESIASSIDTPTPKPRKRTLAFIEKMNQRPISPLVYNQKCYTPVLGRHRLHSDITRVMHQSGSQTPPVVKRSFTFEGRMSGSIPDLTSDSLKSSSLSRSSSTQSLTKKGVEYIAVKCYRAVNDDEISFENGSVLKVLSRSSDGWWEASYKGKTGLVPSVNLKKYKDPIRNMGMHMMDSF